LGCVLRMLRMLQVLFRCLFHDSTAPRYNLPSLGPAAGIL
jgi:hypothetical protein